MDQATSAYQIFLWHIRECCLYSNLDRGLLLPANSLSQEEVESRPVTLYDFSNYRFCPI